MAALHERMSGAALSRPSPFWELLAQQPPAMLFVVLWVLVVFLPLAVLVGFSFFTTEDFHTRYALSLETWRTIFLSGRIEVVWRTMRIAVTVTAISLLLALPFAIWLVKRCRSASLRTLLIALVTLPFFLDVASRTIVWRPILGTEGAVNTALRWFHIAPQSWLLYSEFAVHFGLVVNNFTSMLLPITLILALIDDSLIEASSDLGSTWLGTVWRVILPLAMPGIVAGVVFTLVPVMADVVVPQMLGGFKVNLLGKSIESALSALKYPVAAALSTVVILVLQLMLVLLAWTMRRLNRNVNLFGVLRS
jgi:spermidine/putrescine transport system permease protein